jgi:pimeloyl-ACP methyl ester carboxylesterase
LLDTLAIDTVRMIGLSGGGPYALAAGAALSDRVHGVGVLGGVAPTRGVETVDGGIIQLAVHLAPFLSLARVPLGVGLTQGIRLVKPLAGPALDLYAALQPPGVKNLLARPEFKACSSTTCSTGAGSRPRRRSTTCCSSPGTGASRRPTCRSRCAGGTGTTTIVPFRHGQAMVDRLPDATMRVIDGESHLGGLGIAEEVVATLMELGPRRTGTSAVRR